MEIDPKHLATLHVIHERGGLTAAAGILGTSQPALSRLVADLEIRLGAPLFDRSTRPWRMTSLGETLAAQGSTVRTALSRASHAIEQFKGGTDGLLKLGCTPFVSDSVVTPMIAAFQRAVPDVRMDLSHAYTAQLLRRLNRREVDLVIAPVDTMDISPSLNSRRLIPAKNIIACRKDHPLTRRRKLQQEALLDYRWIAPPADSPLAADLRDVMNRLDAHDIQIAFSGGSLSSIVQILEQSDYLVLLPEHVLNQLARRYDITALALNLSIPTRSVAMLTHADDARSHLLTAFIEFLETEFAALSISD